MASLSSPDGAKAARHEARARGYRRLADWLLEQEQDPEAAGILLYEAAKQCINAVASQQGENPLPTAAKFHFLRRLAATPAAPADLVGNWPAAGRLHINADRNNLAPADFRQDWDKAQTFIDQMLAIYAAA